MAFREPWLKKGKSSANLGFQKRINYTVWEESNSKSLHKITKMFWVKIVTQVYTGYKRCHFSQQVVISKCVLNFM